MKRLLCFFTILFFMFSGLTLCPVVHAVEFSGCVLGGARVVSSDYVPATVDVYFGTDSVIGDSCVIALYDSDDNILTNSTSSAISKNAGSIESGTFTDCQTLVAGNLFYINIVRNSYLSFYRTSTTAMTGDNVSYPTPPATIGTVGETDFNEKSVYVRIKNLAGDVLIGHEIFVAENSAQSAGSQYYSYDRNGFVCVTL